MQNGIALSQIIATGLDKAEAIAPGHGHADLGGFVTSSGYGVTVDVEARINKILAGYAQGAVGSFGGNVDYSATAGLRVRW